MIDAGKWNVGISLLEFIYVPWITFFYEVCIEAAGKKYTDVHVFTLCEERI